MTMSDINAKSCPFCSGGAKIIGKILIYNCLADKLVSEILVLIFSYWIKKNFIKLKE